MNISENKVESVLPNQDYVLNLRNEFPILNQKIYGKPLIYLDNAATSQKPKAVIDALVQYYSTYNANIHRGVHFLSQKGSQAYDEVRTKVKHLINANADNEIVFTRGTTEGINLVAHSYGKLFLKPGDQILISEMEHHSNIVPWQLLCESTGAVLKVIPINTNGEIIKNEYHKLLTHAVKIISVVHVSNSLGTINPIKPMIVAARQMAPNAVVLVDAAQSIVHGKIDVQDLDADFLVFSSHKMCGPTGTGVLYGKHHLLERMQPYQGGGDMIKEVSFAGTSYNEVPFKFEAGTPNIADVIAFGAAIDFLNSLKLPLLYEHEIALARFSETELLKLPGVSIIGNAANKAAVVSFVIEGINTLDVGMYLDTQGIAVRTGQHCTAPLMQKLCIDTTIRASFYFYNTFDEATAFVNAVAKAIKILRP